MSRGKKVSRGKNGKKSGTKQRIIQASLELFSKKGFTETSVREIAAAVGINESSLYNHFDSKGAILDYILEYYRQTTNAFRPSDKALTRLNANATTDDVLLCLMLYYPPEEETDLLRTLQVLFQEQFRNEAVREYITTNMILLNEQYISGILHRLVKSDALDSDTDVDFWAKLHVSVIYKFSTRYVFGIGEMHPGFNGKGNAAMLRTLYDTIFKLHGTKKRVKFKDTGRMK